MLTDSEITFDVRGIFKKFHAIAGIGGDYKGKSVFLVLADGQEVYTTRPIGHGDKENIDVDISGAQKLTLKVVSQDKTLPPNDLMLWADARVVR
jgi:hypothetical protein